MAGMQHGRAKVNGLQLHYIGKGSGPLVLLLHGLPGFWGSWKHQIPVLSRDHRIVAPDLRGIHESDRPGSVEDYRMEMLVGDVVGLIHHFEEESAVVVGQDWGGWIAWHLAVAHPESVSKLICVNAPHPDSFGMLNHDEQIIQLAMTTFLYFLQKLENPGEYIAKDGYAFFNRVFGDALSSDELNGMKTIFAEDDAWPVLFHYYRANLTADIVNGTGVKELGKVKVPTHLIWGEEDLLLSRPLVDRTGDCVDAPFSSTVVPHRGHWVHNEAPEVVNKAILSFL